LTHHTDCNLPHTLPYSQFPSNLWDMRCRHI
jgi:hypothetical protein